MLPQKLSSLKSFTAITTSKYFSRINMAQFIELTGLESLAAKALWINNKVDSFRKCFFSNVGAPKIYSDISIMISNFLQSIWNLSDERIIKRFYDNPEFAVKTGFPLIGKKHVRIIDPGHYCRRRNQLGLWPFLLCFFLLVKFLYHKKIIDFKAIILDATTIKAHFKKDSEAGYCKYKKVFGYKLHLVIDSVSMLPVMFGITSANRHDSLVAVTLFRLLNSIYKSRIFLVFADAGYDTNKIRAFIRYILWAIDIIPKNPRNKGRPRIVETLEKSYFFRWLHRPRTKIERLFGLLKLHRRLEKHYYGGINGIVRYCCLKLSGMLLVALAANEIKKPELSLSPMKLLAHT